MSDAEATVTCANATNYVKVVLGGVAPIVRCDSEVSVSSADSSLVPVSHRMTPCSPSGEIVTRQ